MTNYEILKEYEAHKTPVPSYDEWEQLQNWADFTDDYHELREKLEIAEYKNAQLKEDYKRMEKLLQKMEESDNAREKFQNKQIEKLKKLLKECKLAIFDYPPYDLASDKIRLTQKIDEALK